MKILITGGLGFVGSHLSEFLLKKNHQIIVISKRKSGNRLKPHKNMKIIQADVRNYNQLKTSILKNNPDVIIHLAGNTSHSKSFEDPINDLESNSKSTLNILEILRNYLPKTKFILGSTFVVIGVPKKLPVTEKTECYPTTIYGVSKLSSEHYAQIYNKVYGIKTCIFRITNSFGPREQIIPNKNAINYLIHKAYKKEKISIYYEGKFFRDLIYISDVISGINKIIQKGKSGELYWISSGKKIWFYQFGKIIQDLTDIRPQYIKPPKYTKKVDVGNFVVDNSKLKSLGWKPKVSVKDGVSHTLEYFQKNNL